MKGTASPPPEVPHLCYDVVFCRFDYMDFNYHNFMDCVVVTSFLERHTFLTGRLQLVFRWPFEMKRAKKKHKLENAQNLLSVK